MTISIKNQICEGKIGGKDMTSVKLKTLVDWLKLDNLTPDINLDKIKIRQPDINRPALQIAGYFEHFEATRLQIVGFVEYTYMENLPEDRKEKAYRDFLSFDIILNLVLVFLYKDSSLLI